MASSNSFNVYTPPLRYAGSTPYPGKGRDSGRRTFRVPSPWPLKNNIPVFGDDSVEERVERPRAPTPRRGGRASAASSVISVAPPPPPVEHRLLGGPSPERRELPTVPHAGNWALAPELAPESLNAGHWPPCSVIGARRRLLRWFPLNRPLNEGFRVSQHNLARACQEELILTSVDGERLKGNAMGCFATRAGMTKKFYFVKSPWNRVYVFEEPDPRSRVAREEARLWAQSLANATEEPRIAPSAVPTQWNLTGGSQAPSTHRNWWFFDLR